MKKPYTLIMALFICAAPAFAQISTTAVTLNKIAQPAIRVELAIDEDVSTDFFVDNLKKTGYSVDSKSKLFSKSNKIDEGFYAIKGVRLEGSKELLDLYVKIEREGRKSADESNITILISKEGGFISESSDPASFNAGKRFLNSFIQQAELYNLNLKIKAEEEEVKDAEKKMDKLQDKQKDMEKRIENLQKDLKDNKGDQDDQQKVLEKERKKLEDLKAELKKF